MTAVPLVFPMQSRHAVCIGFAPASMPHFICPASAAKGTVDRSRHTVSSLLAVIHGLVTAGCIGRAVFLRAYAGRGTPSTRACAMPSGLCLFGDPQRVDLAHEKMFQAVGRRVTTMAGLSPRLVGHHRHLILILLAQRFPAAD